MKRSMLLALIAILPFCIQSEELPKLTISASASIWKPADELQMDIGVITIGDTAQDALQENSEKMQNIIMSIQDAGLDSDDYETSRFSINPTYTPCPQHPPANWKQQINGYEVTNTILVRTKKLDIAGLVIDLANRAGANHITNIQFGLHDSRDYWSEALTAAGSNAVSDAQVLAQATGAHLARILSISLNHTCVTSPQLDMAYFGGMSRNPKCTPPIEPGEVSIEASVTIIYEIN